MELPEGYIYRSPCVVWKEKSLLIYSSGSVLYVYDTGSNKLLNKYENLLGEGAIRAISVHKTRGFLLIGTDSKIISVLDSSFKPITKKKTNKKVVDVALVGENIIFVDISGDIISASLGDGEPLCEFSHYSTATSSVLSLDNDTDNYIITGNKDGKIVRNKLPDVHVILNYYLGYTSSISSLLVIGDKNLLVSTSIDNILKIWTLNEGKELYSLDLAFGKRKNVDEIPIKLVWDSLNNTLLLLYYNYIKLLDFEFVSTDENDTKFSLNTKDVPLDLILQSCALSSGIEYSTLYIIDTRGNLHTFILSRTPLNEFNFLELINEDCLHIWKFNSHVNFNTCFSDAIPIDISKHSNIY